jgi:hypothetical protein
LRKRPN